MTTRSTVDVASGWWECVGVWGKGQERVGGAVHRVGQCLPFPFWAWTQIMVVSSLTSTSIIIAGRMGSPLPALALIRRTIAVMWSRRTGSNLLRAQSCPTVEANQ